MKKMLLSTLGYVVASMAVAFPWHMILFHEKYAEMTGGFGREEPIIALGFLSMILQGLVFAYFFPLFLKHRAGKSPFQSGVIYSLFMGLNVWTVMVLVVSAKYKIEPIADFVLYGTSFQVLQYICVGLVLGWIHRRPRSAGRMAPLILDGNDSRLLAG